MKKFSYKVITLSLSLLLMLGACKNLDDLNVNPNSPSPETTDLNLLLPTVITALGGQVVDLGFGDLSGVMQHMQ